MSLFNKIFKRKPIEATEPKKADNEREEMNKAFSLGLEKAKELFIACLANYNASYCQCAYPRFQQIIAIDCTSSGNSYKCYDTDLLIDLAARYFDIEKSELADECKNEKWVCKKCGSTYEYGWSDFSIYVERQKLTLTDLRVQYSGKPVIKPIPLYLGLMGHSYPKSGMTSVSFEEFSSYMLE